jgi:KDO2-lipid IV(A) lauroyltransferase
MPMGVIYFLSDVLYLFVFKIGKYRYKVIIKNLRRSFPEKSLDEIKVIADRFYRFLADLILEGLKLHSLTEKKLRKIIDLRGLEIFNKYYEQGRSVLVVCAHYGSFEYGSVRLTLDLPHLAHTVYKPLANKAFDEFMLKSRSRFGTYMVPTKKIYEVLEKEKESGILSATGLVSDQAPNPFKSYWMEFLNQDTPVYLGCERIARKYNMPVVYAEMEQEKRGRYVFAIYDLIDSPADTVPGEITEKFTKVIEACIRKRPELWLWSHKRWKHKVPDGIPKEQLSVKYPVKNLKKDLN